MGFSLGGSLVGGLIGGPIGAAFGGLKNDLFGVKTGTTTTTATNSPYGPLQPQLDYSLGQARSIYDRGVNPFITQATQLQAQRALDPNNLTNQAQGVLGDTISGKYLTPNSNPYLQSYVNDALGLAKSQFAGQYGGQAGQNLDNSGYQEQLARTLGQVATNAYSQAYGQERQNQLNALSLAPNLDYANTGALYQAGQQQQAAPVQNLAAFQSAFAPALGFGTQTGQQPYYDNRTNTTLGALIGLGSLGASAMMGKPPTPVPFFGVGNSPY